MKHRIGILVLTLGFILFWYSVAHGRAASAAAQSYSMEQGSDFQTGCYGPCDCAILSHGPVKGPFLLTISASMASTIAMPSPM